MIDDFSIVYASSSCSVLIHIQNRRIYLFCRNLKLDDVYGYKADILAMEGISSKELLSHEYKTLWFTLINADNTVDDDVFLGSSNIAALLAFDGTEAPILLREIYRSDIQKGFPCRHYKKETDSIIVSRNIYDLFNLDSSGYRRLIIAGNDYEDIIEPSLTLMNGTRFDDLYEIAKTYFSECEGNASRLLEWIGEDLAENFVCKGRHILDIAMIYGAYPDVEFLFDNGCRSCIANDIGIYGYDQQSFFRFLENIIQLIQHNINAYSVKDLHWLVKNILASILSISSLDILFWPEAPSIYDIRKMDSRLSAYLVKLEEILPLAVFGSSSDNGGYEPILFRAVRALNLFPISFHQILVQSMKAGAELVYEGHSIFYQFIWDHSLQVSPSWLIFKELEEYRSVMTEGESAHFVEYPGQEDLYEKAEAGALLFQLLNRRKSGYYYYGSKALDDGTDTMIFQLVDAVDHHFTNPLGVSILLQACLSCGFSLSFLQKLAERNLDVNRCDTFGARL